MIGPRNGHAAKLLQGASVLTPLKVDDRNIWKCISKRPKLTSCEACFPAVVAFWYWGGHARIELLTADENRLNTAIVAALLSTRRPSELSMAKNRKPTRLAAHAPLR